MFWDGTNCRANITDVCLKLRLESDVAMRFELTEIAVYENILVARARSTEIIKSDSRMMSDWPAIILMEFVPHLYIFIVHIWPHEDLFASTTSKPFVFCKSVFDLGFDVGRATLKIDYLLSSCFFFYVIQRLLKWSRQFVLETIRFRRISWMLCLHAKCSWVNLLWPWKVFYDHLTRVRLIVMHIRSRRFEQDFQ